MRYADISIRLEEMNNALIKLTFGFPAAQMVKHLPAIRETQLRSLGWEDPPEKGMATHSSIIAWRIPWTEEPGGLQSMEVTKSRTLVSDFDIHFQS